MGSPEIVFQDPGGDTFAHGWSYRCPLQPRSSCIVGEKNGNEIVFYSLDPIRGKGKQLGKIEANASMSSGWNVWPDGSRLAFVGGAATYRGRIEVLTFRCRAWHEVSLEPGWGDLQSIAWTADGKGFFVTSYLPDSLNLLHVTLSGKVKRLLRNAHQQAMIRPLPSPDGKYLAFQAETWDRNVWMLENF